MITSHTRGRIRLRLSDLKGAAPPTLPPGGLKGVKSLAVNPRTGGALLEYDPEILGAETIADFVEAFDPGAAEALRHPHLLKARTVLGAPIPALADCPPPAVPVRSPDAPPAAGPPAPKRPARRRGSAEATSELLNLGSAVLGVVISGFFGSRRLHVQLGVLTGLMMIGHVWKYRKRLRPLHQMTIHDLLGLPDFSRPPWGRPAEEPAAPEDPADQPD
jgi:hypothetical protein